MTVSVRQEISLSLDGTNAGSVQVTFSIPVLSGSSIHVAGNVGANVTISCADSVNGSYGTALDTAFSAPITTAISHFNFDSSAAGTPTVTLTFGTSSPFGAIWIREISGTSGIDSGKHALNIQAGGVASPRTAGTITPSVAPGLASVIALDATNSGHLSVDTGFSTGATGWGYPDPGAFGFSEQQRYTSTAPLACNVVTSDPTNDTTAIVAAFFKETATPNSATIAWVS